MFCFGGPLGVSLRVANFMVGCLIGLPLIIFLEVGVYCLVVWHLLADLLLARFVILFREPVPSLVIFACSGESVPFARLYVQACIF